jgi:hypothetical protein
MLLFLDVALCNGGVTNEPLSTRPSTLGIRLLGGRRDLSLRMIHFNALRPLVHNKTGIALIHERAIAKIDRLYRAAELLTGLRLLERVEAAKYCRHPTCDRQCRYSAPCKASC